MLNELTLYWGTSLYFVFAFLSFMAFMMVSIKRGWLMRLLLLPTIIFPFFYVYFYFSQNLPDGHNDGWLTYFVRSSGNPTLLKIYNELPDLIINHPVLFVAYMPSFLALILISACFADFKPLAGKGVPRRQSIKEVKLFALALLATFAYHLNQYDPLNNFYFLQRLTPIEQSQNIERPSAFIQAFTVSSML